jgi:very-short-patch-repair endonuclease
MPEMPPGTVVSRSVDFLWPSHALIVETDGYEAHGTRRASRPTSPGTPR